MTYKEALNRLRCGGARSIADASTRADYEATIAEALTKQIPQHPETVRKVATSSTGDNWLIDGNCECGKCIYLRDKYCPECGQAIEWGRHATLNTDCQWK